MKKIFIIIALMLICSFSITTQSWAIIFVEGWNINNSPAVDAVDAIWGATQVAWLYVPSQTYDLARVEFYGGGEDRSNVAIQLRQYDAGDVGSVLTSGTFNHSAVYGWQGADITPYQVASGTSYWVAMWYTDGLYGNITYDETAVEIPYRWGVGWNENSYPYSYIYDKPMAKFYGEGNPVPEPASLALLGLGLVGLLGLRRKKGHEDLNSRMKGGE